MRLNHLLELIILISKSFNLICLLEHLQLKLLNNLGPHLLVLGVEGLHGLLYYISREGTELCFDVKSNAKLAH